MKSFENVYKRSKTVTLNEQQKVYGSEKATLVAAIKHEYGVNDFSKLSEKEKASYKAMIAEMWSPISGINEKGKKFLNESAAVLTEKSTDEQVEKYFKKEVKANLESVMECIVLSKECGFLKELKAKVEEGIKKKLSNKVAKQWLFDVCCNYVGSKIKSVKF